jgi:hypothetical protein
MKRFSGWTVISAMFLFWLALAPFKAESFMSSDNYQIQWDSVGQGGEDTSSSASYKVRDTFGTLQGIGTSASYREDSGFRAGIYDPTVSFNVFSQSMATQVAATSLSSNTVTVTTTSGYAVGDYIAIIQNQGASQVSAIGKVIAVGGSTLTVDELKDNGTSPTIDGSNDYVYVLSGSALPFGTLSTSVVTAGIVGFDTSADVSGGYNVYIYEDQDLTSGSDVIADVTDGSVTANDNEYGAISSDTTLAASTFDTQDTAITSSLQQIASRSDNTLKSRDFLTLKVGIDTSQPNGSYTQTLTFVFVGNY